MRQGSLRLRLTQAPWSSSKHILVFEAALLARRATATTRTIMTLLSNFVCQSVAVWAVPCGCVSEFLVSKS